MQLHPHHLLSATADRQGVCWLEAQRLTRAWCYIKAAASSS